MKIRILNAFLALVIAAGTLLTACGGDTTGDNASDTTAAADNAVSEETAAETEKSYEFAQADFGGKDFQILYCSTTWGFTEQIIAEEETGDAVNDTMYKINTQIEEMYNLNLVGYPKKITEMTAFLVTNVLAGDDVFKYNVTSSTVFGTPDTFDCVYDLTEFDEINNSEPWYNQNIIASEQIITGDSIYFIPADISLIGVEDAMCIFYNEDKAETLGLDQLYDTVRAGEWTIDLMRRYAKAATNLNGDESFAFKLDGNAVYGLSTWDSGVRAMTFGMGNTLSKLDGATGKPVIAFENERYYTTVDLLTEFHSTEGEVLVINSTPPMHYEDVFKAGRSMFTCAQLKGSLKYRDMEDNYGIVPLPKFDTKQENYYAHCTTNTQQCSIPITNPEPEKTAAVLDAMAYLSYTEVLPAYWSINMEQKQLRNEDSIEMLALINANRQFDIAMGFRWTNDFVTAINSAVLNGTGGAASITASHKSAIEAKIAATLEALGE